MLQLLLFIICLSVYVCLIQKIQLGFALVVALDLLVVRAVTFMGLPLREMFMLAVWFSFLHNIFVKKTFKLSFDGLYKKPLMIFFTGIIIIFVFSSNELGIAFQLKHIFGLIYYLSYCYIGWTIYNTQKSIILFSKVIFATSLIMALYGVFCYVTTSNPYLSILENFTDETIIGGMTEERGGFHGRIQSTMSHPLTWGGCCCLLFLFFLQNGNKIQQKLVKYFLLFLLGINTFLTGSRSVIIAFFMCFLILFFYKIKKHGQKTLFYLLISAVIVFTCIYSIPQMQKYKGLFESVVFFWNEDISTNNNIQGSSVSMRGLQLLESLDTIKDNLLFGIGHGYVDYYVSTFGPHDILYGFESLVFNKLTEGGFIDLFLWLYLFYVIFCNINKINEKLYRKQDISILKAFVIFYFIYAIFTGFMQTFLCFIILYVIQIKIIILKDRQIRK